MSGEPATSTEAASRGGQATPDVQQKRRELMMRRKQQILLKDAAQHEAAGDYYAAQQCYKTLYFQASQMQQWDRAIECLRSGASRMFAAQQPHLGAELTLLLIEALRASGAPHRPANLALLRELCAQCEASEASAAPSAAAAATLPDTAPATLETHSTTASAPTSTSTTSTTFELLDRVVRASLEWSSTAPEAPLGICAVHPAAAPTAPSSSPFGASPTGANTNANTNANTVAVPYAGDPALHVYYAAVLVKRNQLGMACHHLLRGDDSEATLRYLLQMTESALPEEYDLFVARLVLGYAARGNLKDAHRVLTGFVAKRFPGSTDSAVDDGLPAPPPLVNFLRFLLLTLERDNTYPLFQRLTQVYAPSLARDPDFQKSLDKIAEVFYNVKKQPQGLSGIMNMVSSMFQAPSSPARH